MTKKKYIKFFAILTVLQIMGLSLFNIYLDPFGSFPTLSAEKFKQFRPSSLFSRIAKAEMFKNSNCKTLLVGSSRVESGFDPEHSAWAGRPVCNLGLPGGMTTREAKNIFIYAQSKRNIETVFWGIDFFNFNETEYTKSDYEHSLFNSNKNNIDYFLDKVLSYSTTVMSKNLLISYLENSAPAYTNSGFRNRIRTPEQVLIETKLNLKNFIYAPGPYRPFVFGKSLEHFEAALEKLAANHIKTYIAIVPVNALQLETIYQLGLSEAYWSWKRQLALISKSISSKHKVSIKVWDFSGFRFPNNEPIFESKGNTIYFNDSSHIKPFYGSLIVDSVLSDKKLDFSLALDEENLGEYKGQLNRERIEWQNENKFDYDQLLELLKKFRN